MKRETLRWAVWWSIPVVWVLQGLVPESGPITGWILGVFAGGAAAYGALGVRPSEHSEAE